MHLVHTLPAREGGGYTGRNAQHWHRDTGLLYEGDERFHLREDVHARAGGLHLPPYVGHYRRCAGLSIECVTKSPHQRTSPTSYALNVFVPLVDFTETNGPTEFTLGSHMWGSTWADDEEVRKGFGGGGGSDSRDNTKRRSRRPRDSQRNSYGHEWCRACRTADKRPSLTHPRAGRGTPRRPEISCPTRLCDHRGLSHSP